MLLMITGGAGFIGSALIRYVIDNYDWHILNVDKLTYSANLDSLENVIKNQQYHFAQVDICDPIAISKVIKEYQPDAIMHLAAESHVDRSIDSPADFIKTNILGTYTLLEATIHYWNALNRSKRNSFRFHHISTDEVYGMLGPKGKFTEDSAYKPNSPYAASKASSDHLVRAWYKTYSLPVIITNSSNNYGPYQYPEKLIPLMILNAVNGKSLPIYGDGKQIRDWLYVYDHCRALMKVLTKGGIGQTYNIGSNCEKTNIEVVYRICSILDELIPNNTYRPHSKLIDFVQDRPGHDRRYAIDARKINHELEWSPSETFETGLRKTVQWYLDNNEWCQQVRRSGYQGERLGLLK